MWTLNWEGPSAATALPGHLLLEQGERTGPYRDGTQATWEFQEPSFLAPPSSPDSYTCIQPQGPALTLKKRRKESQTWGWKPGQGSFLRHSWGRVFLGQAPARSPNTACLQLGASLPTQGSCSGSTLFVVSPLEGPRRRPTGQLSHMASFSVT